MIPLVERERILAKVRVGSAVYWPKNQILEIIASYEIRQDKMGFYYNPKGASHSQSVHFYNDDKEALILEEHEIEMVDLLYGKET